MTKCTKTRSSGFTLIELLIVVVILSALASIVIPNLFSMGDQSKIAVAVAVANANANANATIKNIQKKITAYRELNGHWPAEIDSSWFIRKKPPRSPFAPNHAGNTININDSPTKWHAGYKTLETFPPFWYCRGNGSFRIRVPTQATDEETLTLYNAANMSSASSLSDIRY